MLQNVGMLHFMLGTLVHVIPIKFRINGVSMATEVQMML